MNEDRKNELGKKILFDDSISKDELKELEIQELIFLIFTAQYYKKKDNFKDVDFKNKIKLYMNAIKEMIREADKMYIAYNEATKYPHTDYGKRAWIFSNEEYALQAKDHFMQSFLMLDMRPLDNDGIIRAFADFHRLGIEAVTVDNGQYTLDIERDEILPPMNYEGLEKAKIPLTNPKLSYAFMKFFQEASNKHSNYPGKNEALKVLEDEMLKEIINAEYLVPMMIIEETESSGGKVFLKKGNNIRFALLEDMNKDSWQPAFTDWIEFQKNYDKNIWNGQIVSYRDLVALSEGKKGFVINPSGLKVQIDKKNKKRLEEYIIENTEKKQIEDDIEKLSVKIGEPKGYKAEMLEETIEYMKKNKSIKKAYFRSMSMIGEETYLMIIEVEGNRDVIFEDIKNICKKYIENIPLELTEMVTFRENLNNVKPFYKKKMFGLF